MLAGSRRTQPVEETVRMYRLGRTDELEQHIKTHYDEIPESYADLTDVDFTRFWKKFKHEVKTNITRDGLKERLMDMDYEITDRGFRCEPAADGSLHTYSYSTNREAEGHRGRVAILGIRAKVRVGQEALKARADRFMAASSLK